MSQGFNPRRHKVDSGKASRWVAFREVLEERNCLPSHPEALRLLIQALSSRIRCMARAKKERRLAETKNITSNDIDVLQRVVSTLITRIMKLDRTAKKELALRIVLYIKTMEQRLRWPNEADTNTIYRSQFGHLEELFEDELRAIAKGRLTNFMCLPSVLRLQRDLLYEIMARRAPDGYAKSDTPMTWIRRNHQRIYEELTLYGCPCMYRHELKELSRMVISGQALNKRDKKNKRMRSIDQGTSWVLEEWTFPPCERVFPDLKAPDLDIGMQAALKSKGPGEMIPAILFVLHRGLSASSIRQVLKTSSRRSKIPSFLQ